MESLPNVFLDRAGSLPMTGDLNIRNNRINNLHSNPQIGLDVVNKNHVDLVVRKSDLTFIHIVFKPPFPSFGLRTQNYERKNCGGSPKYYTTRDLDYLGYHKNRSNLMIVLLYIVLKKITKNTPSQGT